MMGYGWGMGGWGMGFVGWIMMGLVWLVPVVAVLGLAVLLLPNAAKSERPGELLDRRFALGELDVEEYRRAREELAHR
jgi:putative membrane protein